MTKTLTPTHLHIIETALEVAAAHIATQIKRDERSGDFESASLARVTQSIIAKGRDALDPAPMRSPRVAHAGTNAVRDAFPGDPLENLPSLIADAERAA